MEWDFGLFCLLPQSSRKLNEKSGQFHCPGINARIFDESFHLMKAFIAICGDRSSRVGNGLEGDHIKIDIPARKIELLVGDDEIGRRRKAWKGAPDRDLHGYIRRYAKEVSSGAQGAVFER